jgi:hypothetical protein
VTGSEPNPHPSLPDGCFRSAVARVDPTEARKLVA